MVSYNENYVRVSKTFQNIDEIVQNVDSDLKTNLVNDLDYLCVLYHNDSLSNERKITLRKRVLNIVEDYNLPDSSIQYFVEFLTKKNAL